MAFRDVIASLFGPAQNIQVTMGPMFSQMVQGLTVEELYRTQPHLRTVIDFRARNIAHIGLQTFRRLSDSDRRRERESTLALLVAQPNETQTQYEWLTTVQSDFDLYDASFNIIAPTPETLSGWSLKPIPPSWIVEMNGGTLYQPDEYVVALPNGSRISIPASSMLVLHGYNPGKPRVGSPAVDALRDVLAEQVQAWIYRKQQWSNSGRFGAVIKRPKDAPAWSDAAAERFSREWKARWTERGSEAGGTPVLEDGMEIQRLGFNAREDEWAEVSKLALTTVAAAFHVNPVMVGVLDNANFSNTKEFRKMLYTETLGPSMALIESAFNTRVARAIGADRDEYVEFNISEKLQGDFEEQAALLQSAVGGPYMSRNEARARLNLPRVEDADGLIVPLNVLIGGQASPQDSGSQNQRMGAIPRVKTVVSVKSPDAVSDDHVKLAEKALRDFYRAQGERVLAFFNQKADEQWWDEDAEDVELSDVLYAVSIDVADEIGQAQAKQLGFTPDEYDTERTRGFLRAVADSRAGAVNAATKQRIQKALDNGSDPAEVFDEAESARVGSGAKALVAALAGFALMETARQLIAPNYNPSKTWIVTSANPRPEHAAMDGETVGIDELFSNGADWPGDVKLGPEGVSNCQCGIEITFNG